MHHRGRTGASVPIDVRTTTTPSMLGAIILRSPS
jgi:hypothetical protein